MGTRSTRRRPRCESPDGAWHPADVSLSCTASDGGSGLADAADASFDLSTSVANGDETANAATGSKTVEDAVGNDGTAGPISGNKIDKKAPAVACGAADAAWHADDVSIGCTASDGGSGLEDAGDAAFDLTTNVPDGTETANASTDSRTVKDALGHSTPAGPITGNKVDKKAPAVTCGTADAAWHADDVSIGCTASDGGSGLEDAGDAAFDLTTNVPDGTETANASTNSKTIKDAVGHGTPAGPIAGNKVDKKDPAVTCDPADGQWHASNVSLACSASDGGSGLANAADANFTLSTTVPDGTETATASTGSKAVADLVGNSATGGPIGNNKIDRKGPNLS